MDKARLKFLLGCLDQVFEGKKLDLNSETKIVYDIFDKLYSKNLLLEKPQEYFTSKTYTPIGDTSTISLPFKMTKIRRGYDKDLRKQATLNIRMIGSKVSDLNNDRLERLYDESAAHIMPQEVSAHAVYELLYILNKKAEGVDDKPFFIHTKDKKNKIFNKIAKDIGLKPSDLLDLNIFEHDSQDKIINQISKKVKKQLFNNELEFNIGRNATFYVATTSDKKLIEMEEYFSKFGIKVKSIAELIGPFKDADELHGTAEVNAVGTNDDKNSGKYYTIKKSIEDNYTKEELTELLLKNGANPQNSYIITDDRAAMFHEKLMAKALEIYGNNIPAEINELMFGKYGYDYKTLIKNKNFPGAEIKHFIDALGGQEKFWNEMAELSQDKDKRFIENYSVVSISPIFDCYKENPRLFVTSSKIKSAFIDEARPKHPYVESEQFTIPYNDTRTLKEMTEAGDYDAYYKTTDIGRALKALVNNFNLREFIDKNTETYESYKVSVIGNNHKVDGFKTNFLENSSGLKSATDFEKFIANHDAFVFDGNLKKKDFAATAHLFFAAAVAKQTDPRDIKKLIVINNPNENFRKLIDLYHSLYGKGYIKEYPARMFSITHNNEELERVVIHHAREYRPVDFEYDHNEITPLKIPEKEAIFSACSSSSDTPENITYAAKIAYYLALSGRDIVYGSGDKKMMGGTYKGYLAAKKYAEENNIPFNSEIIGSSTTNLLKRETYDGKKPENIKDENFYFAPTIHHRKEFLVGSSTSAIVLYGGAGTLEELFFARTKSGSYQINVLNGKGTYDYLKDIPGSEKINILQSVEEILTKVYNVDISDQKAAKFLEDHLKPKTNGQHNEVASVQTNELVKKKA